MSHRTCSRREFLAIAAALPLLTACEPPPPLPDWMLTPDDAADPGLRRDALVIGELLVRHREIRREVEHFSTGIRATTTSAAPDLAEQIRVHAEQMQSRLWRGAPIRQEDPLFAAVFAHHRQVLLQVERLADGVRVTETSKDPVAVMLLRQHAVHAVSEFVAGGVDRARRSTPLPPGYPG
ncbi:hypothetical protein SAMN05421805_1011526 [Saccharopolyspora antimicrobica]|uniref:Uncharacterized protein n=1 Tax=Saccharopolyspora antimicrobica TaxID=455193 RepID=A0A1I4TQ07_9PSEU|nr:hypothetical protein [Saccharopolyspora antimicrobica]RKT88505.1 hypothetical protein ATL45_6940 [Saccharopolyspora antimicrobica]SFM78832.1 hypothetical protein SAMN05421805_1011526 [Saccharopolyspora antimicrobica]